MLVLVHGYGNNWEPNDSPVFLITVVTFHFPQHLSDGLEHFHIQLKMSRTALFVVDIQRALADNPETEIPCAGRIREAGTSILSKARKLIDKNRARGEALGLEVVVVQHEEQPEQGNLVRGSKEWDVVFPPREDEFLVSKTVRACFSIPTYSYMTDIAGDTFQSNPELTAELKARNVGTIVVFGIQSECCVLSTCRGALTAGFKVVLLRGAHSTYDVGEWAAAKIERRVEEQLKEEDANIMDWKTWALRSLEEIRQLNERGT